MRIVVGNSTVASYPQGGGHWMVTIQCLLGLQDLGHDVFLLGLLRSRGNPNADSRFVNTYFERLKPFELHHHAALLVMPQDVPGHDLRRADIYGIGMQGLVDIIDSADMLWNNCGNVASPLLDRFRHRVYLDGDPGHTHVSALTVNMQIERHHVLLTAGLNVNGSDSEVPTLGLKWNTYRWFVYLPLWRPAPEPEATAPFSSVTHWNWGELWLNDRVLSISKRDAYLRYVDLPSSTGRPFELATYLDPQDPTGDRDVLLEHGWQLADPWHECDTPENYRRYISKSRAEISCPKPVYRELKTGWFSDRSACYLASGRPVLAEDTGFSKYLPTDAGLLTFHDLPGAVAGVAEIDAHYTHHSRAARRFAEEHLDSRKCLRAMLDVC
ncbi:MAG: hypothetical protein KAX65_01215 [Caldilineaceae bacterium]|nr:hypothetical protein [Caldilineaceae bacterium]